MPVPSETTLPLARTLPPWNRYESTVYESGMSCSVSQITDVARQANAHDFISAFEVTIGSSNIRNVI